jgi:hypothetical protein
MVLIHRFYVLGVDLHFHKFSSPNSLYFGRNRRFYLPICAQIDKKISRSIPNRLKLVCTPEIAGLNQKFRTRKSANRLKPAESSPGHRHLLPLCLAGRPYLLLSSHRPQRSQSTAPAPVPPSCLHVQAQLPPTHRAPQRPTATCIHTRAPTTHSRSHQAPPQPLLFRPAGPACSRFPARAHRPGHRQHSSPLQIAHAAQLDPGPAASTQLRLHASMPPTSPCSAHLRPTPCAEDDPPSFTALRRLDRDMK